MPKVELKLKGVQALQQRLLANVQAFEEQLEDELLMIRKACSRVNTDFSMIFLGHIPLKKNLQAESLKRAYHLYNEFKRNNI